MTNNPLDGLPPIEELLKAAGIKPKTTEHKTPALTPQGMYAPRTIDRVIVSLNQASTQIIIKWNPDILPYEILIPRHSDWGEGFFNLDRRNLEKFMRTTFKESAHTIAAENQGSQLVFLYTDEAPSVVSKLLTYSLPEIPRKRFISTYEELRDIITTLRGYENR